MNFSRVSLVPFSLDAPKVLAHVGGHVRGVGTGIMYSLVRLADELGIGTIWGETTQGSVPFYEKVLGLPRVTHHFFVHGPTMKYCRRQFERIAG